MPSSLCSRWRGTVGTEAESHSDYSLLCGRFGFARLRTGQRGCDRGLTAGWRRALAAQHSAPARDRVAQNLAWSEAGLDLGPHSPPSRFLKREFLPPHPSAARAARAPRRSGGRAALESSAHVGPSVRGCELFLQLVEYDLPPKTELYAARVLHAVPDEEKQALCDEARADLDEIITAALTPESMFEASARDGRFKIVRSDDED